MTNGENQKPLTKKDLCGIGFGKGGSGAVMNNILGILRNNSVSDKPNAFNKIFNLFLCKVTDEGTVKDGRMGFQWVKGEDDHFSLHKRLIRLYDQGIVQVLGKPIWAERSNGEGGEAFMEMRLKTGNEFSIKEVNDKSSFKDNANIIKEIVQLLQPYCLSSTLQKQLLSDFFELLLTTGLKQEAGQFFTPVPIARFITRSLPIKNMAEEGERPKIIDPAAGSGHFLTVAIEEIQQGLKTIPTEERKKKENGEAYVYGIEKDYRLYKTSTLNCHMQGKGSANLIHGDGIADFSSSKHFHGILKKTDKEYPQDNKQFDAVLSNPPYSVLAFKSLMDAGTANKAFDLFKHLTDKSPEIESMFIERTKQLLKNGGVAGIVLPSSILSNNGIYTPTREIILKYFQILAITELGSNTFMSTGVSTVILFLRRKDNAWHGNFATKINQYFLAPKIKGNEGIKNGIKQYAKEIWELNIEDYDTLIDQKPNENIKNHEIYQGYQKAKMSWESLIALEKEKLLYFNIAYGQNLVFVRTGDKMEEKMFLGYEFSNRKRKEGIFSIKHGATIGEATRLYDPEKNDNPEKASTYIYRAFTENKFDLKIPKNLKKNISYHRLTDMLTFDRPVFCKGIQSPYKKINFKKVWEETGYKTEKLILLAHVAEIKKGKSITKSKARKGDIPVISGGKDPMCYHDTPNTEKEIITVAAKGTAGFVNYFEKPVFASDCFTVKSKNETETPTKFIYYLLHSIQKYIYLLQKGVGVPSIYMEDIVNLKIPKASKEKINHIMKAKENIK